ncbi:hypothetical protein LPJ74_001371, partial [Coemansia sp. RSA 1843]
MVTPKQMRPAPRCDILCVLVVESTQQLQHVFPELYDTVIARIIAQLRTPIVVDTSNKKDAGTKKTTGPVTKATPCVRLGVVFFGDYFPYSTQTCSTQYFTSNYREFTKTVKAHRFREGGMLRCAATEGLVGALEMFDDFEEFDPEAHLTNVQQRHTILVTSTPPYSEPCRENGHMRYDNYTLEDVAQRMRELKISFSLIQERGKRIDQMEALLGSANVSTRQPLELPAAMSPHFDTRLMGIDIHIPREFMDSVSAPQPIAPAAILPNNPPPVHIQPQPIISPPPSSSVSIQPQSLATVPTPQQQISVSTATSLLPQKNKAAEAASSAAAAGAVSVASGKKQKTDQDAQSATSTMAVTAASPVTAEESAKPTARTKGRAKGSGGRKTSRASNSPAVAAKPTPPAAAAAAA